MGVPRRFGGMLLLAVLAHLQLSALACPMDGMDAGPVDEGAGLMSHAGHHAGDTGDDPADGSGDPAPCAAMMACGAPASPAALAALPSGSHVTTSAPQPSAALAARVRSALEPPPPRVTS